MATSKIIPQDKFKDVLIKRTSEKTEVPEEVVAKIIDFEFKDARDALHRFSQVEISGFGKFIVSNAKTRKKIRRLHDIEEAYIRKLDNETLDLADSKKDLLLSRLGVVRENIERLKTRMI